MRDKFYHERGELNYQKLVGLDRKKIEPNSLFAY